MLLVILTGGIDLSVGSVVAMSGVLIALFSQSMSLTAAILAALASGILAGAISGYLLSYQKMAPFIATLALMTIVRGCGFIFSKGAPIVVVNQAAALTDFGSGRTLGIPNPAIILFIVFAITTVILKYNVFGRILIAIGSNEEAVHLSGIKVHLYKFSVYAITGGLAALAGIISTARTSVGSCGYGVGCDCRRSNRRHQFKRRKGLGCRYIFRCADFRNDGKCDEFIRYHRLFSTDYQRTYHHSCIVAAEISGQINYGTKRYKIKFRKFIPASKRSKGSFLRQV